MFYPIEGRLHHHKHSLGLRKGLRYSNGKYHGTISKWNEAGTLWEEAEFDRGNLVEFTIKKGKPFDASQIIDLSKDPSTVELLFK